MGYLRRFRVRPGSEVKLKDIDPASKDHHVSHEEALEEIARLQGRLRELQYLLYAVCSSARLQVLVGGIVGEDVLVSGLLAEPVEHGEWCAHHLLRWRQPGERWR